MMPAVAKWLLRCSAGALLMLSLVAVPAAPAQELPGIACIVPIMSQADTDRIFGLHHIPGVGALIRAEKGWFLARAVNGAIGVKSAGIADTGNVFWLHALTGARILIGAEKGLFLASVEDDAAKIEQAGIRIGSARVFSDLARGGVLVGADRGVFLANLVDDRANVDPARGAKTGPVFGFHELPGAGMLVSATEGLFLARLVDHEVEISPVGTDNIGDVLRWYDFSGGGVLIQALSGWYVVHRVEGGAKIDSAGHADTGRVNGFRSLPQAGVLIQAENGLFLVRVSARGTEVARAGSISTGAIRDWYDFPGVGVLVQAEENWFLARAVDGGAAVDPAGTNIAGNVQAWHDFPGAGMLIAADGGLFLARGDGRGVKVEQAGDIETGAVSDLHDFPGAGVLIKSEMGLFLARAREDSIIFERAGGIDTGSVLDWHDLPGVGMLVQAEGGWFLARADSGSIDVKSAGTADTGDVGDFYDIPGVGVLIAAEEGLFLARGVDGQATIVPIGGAETGKLIYEVNFPGGGVLTHAKKGWFLARKGNDGIILDAAGDADVAGIPLNPEYTHEVPGAGLLIRAKNGLFGSVSKPLSDASVGIFDKENLDGSTIDPKRKFDFALTLAHACARAADKLDVKVRIIEPGGKPHNEDPRFITTGDIAQVTIPLVFDTAGEWSFQLVSTSGGIERPIGKAQTLTFVEGPWFERWWKTAAAVLGALLVIANIALFLFARRSAWAWRLATDDGWGTGVLRVATLLLSHIPAAQLWILDLYFRRARAEIKAPRPFLPVPLARADGSVQSSSEALLPPWTGRRLWVQGGSGMGKTDLFRTNTEPHFRDYETAFAAYAKWGCVVVAFSARDFAAGGDDKDDPAWVVDAVRATLSGYGLTFASEALLSRFLESGTIGVAIDGLNEVDRTRAVGAFSRAFNDAPMLVTSQEIGDDRFKLLRLPTDIRAFTFDLLKLYLGPQEAEALFERINASGLKDAIRSGYDVRLVIDLALADPHHTALSTDRVGLYAAVIDAGWPDGPAEARREQQSRTAAAAWRMVSERKANEDMRRLKPDIDLDAGLLKALAKAPQSEKKPVRLLRRVGGDAFEFVHDQMHAYLAARWFAQDGLSVAELEKMAAGSTIWTQAPDARRTLWGFASALLDDERLAALLARVEDKEEWDVLRRALKAEAERRGLRQAAGSVRAALSRAV